MKFILSTLCGILVAGAVLAQSPTPAASAAPAASPVAAATPAPAAAAPTPTLDQRVSVLEAYLNNGDPTAAFKDASGNPLKGWADPANAGAVNLTAASYYSGGNGQLPGPGDNAWMETSSAFVLMMTLPGLALFYGGMCRQKNVLSMLAMCFICTGAVTILWWAVGYSLAFGASYGTTNPGIAPFLGGNEFFFLKGVDYHPNTNYAYWVSNNIYCIFQLTFAIITVALLFGATAERLKFSAVFAICVLWMFVVYFPQAHMVWGSTGIMNGVWNSAAKIPAIDFAGGTVVHMTSGWSALVICLILGKRIGYGKEPMPPHSTVLTMIGTGLLWVGWYGFNAGSSVAADMVGSNAFLTTTLTTAVGSFVWPMLEWIFKGKPTVLGFCSGAVAGLVVITPACGFVNATGAMWLGLAAGCIPFLTVNYMKKALGYDDALDTFGVHGVGGMTGAILAGVFADPSVNPNIAKSLAAPLNPATQNGLADAIINHTLWKIQLEAVGVTILLATIGSAIIALVVKLIIGLRPTEDNEQQGLDITDHGEEGYILS